MNLEKLAKSEEFILMWQYRMLGHFKTALMEAICLADDGNLARLRLGFPNEVDGYINYTQVNGWWQVVQKKAGIEPD